MNEITKIAWIDQEKKIVSFHAIDKRNHTYPL